jgi:hydrophobic/amphiphilic exporter-1 (mainly G- bacteria), HAE1 family
VSLTRLFIKRPTLVFVLIALMTFGGIISVVTLVRQLFPNVTQPTISILVTYNGASVTEMRDNIVAPIEQNLAGSTNLQTINSVVQQGRATISAIYTLDSDVATDLTLTQKAVQNASKQLPTNITPPTVSINDPSESVVITLALFSKKLSLGQLSLYADNVIAPKIQQIPGISFANVIGDVTPAYEVEVDPFKLLSQNLTLTDVINAVGNQNNRVPGGIAYEPNRETSIDVRGDVTDLNSVARLPIAPPSITAQTGVTSGQINDPFGGLSALPGNINPWSASNSLRRVEDVAKTVDGYEPVRRIAQINGRPGLFMSIQKASDASEVTASQNVLNALPLLRRQFPEIEFSVLNTQSKFSQQQIELVTRTLMEGVLLTGIAMVFFLRSWRNALVVCVSIPTSLAIALTAMKLLGLTLDTISLLAMSLVIGILVDDSTVVLENIERHHDELGESPEEAAVKGREEIGAAAVVITLVDVVVFFPIAFIQGQVGRNLNEFAIVVVISTLTSLFVSFTVTPTLAGLWALKSKWKPWPIVNWFTSGFDKTRDYYAHRVLPWALDHGGLVAGLCALSFIGSIALIPLGVVGEEFIPATDRGQIFVQTTWPVGTPLTHVRDGLFGLEAKIDKLSDVDAEATSAGGYSASFGGYVLLGNVGQIVVFLKDGRKHPTDYWVTQIRDLARKDLPEAQTFVVPSTSTGGGNQQPIDLLVYDVTGTDPTADAGKVLALLRQTPGAIGVNSSGTTLAPEVSIEFDRAKSQALNVDLGTAANAAGAAFGGDVVTQFETPQGLKEVQVIYPLLYQTELESLKEIPIRSNAGAVVHMSDIASFKVTPTPPLVTRTDRNTVIHVDANFAPGSSLSNVERAFFKRLPSLHLPPSVVVRPAPLGQQDFMQQTLSGLGQSMILSVVLVFLLMVALYNSYRSPFIILFSVPVAAVGAIGALLLTHKTLNLFSLIGIILLIGIATKNGVLLVDYANTLRKRGLHELEAIKESAHTRFRPIVMTSFSVVAGNIPLALALEPGSVSRSSLGIVVIGGVISSLVLTLLLVPNAYMWLAPKNLAPEEPDEPVEKPRFEHSPPVPAGV